MDYEDTGMKNKEEEEEIADLFTCMLMRLEIIDEELEWRLYNYMLERGYN